MGAAVLMALIPLVVVLGMAMMTLEIGIAHGVEDGVLADGVDQAGAPPEREDRRVNLGERERGALRRSSRASWIRVSAPSVSVR